MVVASFLDEEVTLKRMVKLKNHLKNGGTPYDFFGGHRWTSNKKQIQYPQTHKTKLEKICSKNLDLFVFRNYVSEGFAVRVRKNSLSFRQPGLFCRTVRLFTTYPRIGGCHPSFRHPKEGSKMSATKQKKACLVRDRLQNFRELMYTWYPKEATQFFFNGWKW